MTDAHHIYDRNMNVMPNGGDLTGVNAPSAVMIIPWPCHDGQYLVITSDPHGDRGPMGAMYSIVDMSLNHGLGDVTKKSVVFDTSAGMHMTAIHCGAGNDYWLLLHRKWETTFLAYLVSDRGISEKPVLSSCGLASHWSKGYGFLKGSPNGRKLAMTNIEDGTVELFDFDPTAGVVSNPLTSYQDSDPFATCKQGP